MAEVRWRSTRGRIPSGLAELWMVHYQSLGGFLWFGEAALTCAAPCQYRPLYWHFLLRSHSFGTAVTGRSGMKRPGAFRATACFWNVVQHHRQRLIAAKVIKLSRPNVTDDFLLVYTLKSDRTDEKAPRKILLLGHIETIHVVTICKYCFTKGFKSSLGSTS